MSIRVYQWLKIQTTDKHGLKWYVCAVWPEKKKDSIMKSKDNEEKIIKINSKDLKNLESNTNWEKVDRQIALDHDAAKVLATEWFKKATWVKPTKKGINLRLDNVTLSN